MENRKKTEKEETDKEQRRTTIMFLGIGITRNSIILLVSVLFVFAKGSDKLSFVNNVAGEIVLSYLNFFDVCEMQLLNKIWNKKLTATYISAIEDSIHREYGDTRVIIFLISLIFIKINKVTC